MNYADAERSTYDGSPLELFKFELGPIAYAYTSGDAEHDYQGLNYLPEAISREQLTQDEEDGAGSLTISLPTDNPVAQLFTSQLPSRQLFITIYRTQRGTGEYTVAFVGAIAAASFSEGACTLTCQPDSASFQRQVPSKLFQHQCRHVLFSQTEYYGTSVERTDSAQATGCNLKKANYRTAATVEVVQGIQVKAAAFATKPDGYFTYGHIELAGGDVRWITAHYGDTLELAYKAGIEPGDTIIAYPGCDGLESTCRGKFNNVINFSGFTRIPSVNPFNSSLT